MAEPSEPPGAEQTERLPAALGWCALLIGVLCWMFDAPPPGRVTGSGIIYNLYGHAVTGILAAIGIGLGLFAIRRDSSTGIAWFGLLVNATLVLFEIMRIADRL